MLRRVAAPTDPSDPPSKSKPLAIRIQRPYETEADLLAAEAGTLTRSTLLLLGAKNRPPGTPLRFELVLRTGAAVFRGEGKVVEYREESGYGVPGLLVKFNRLDARSKKLLEELLGPQSIAPGSVAPGSLAPGSLAPMSMPVPELEQAPKSSASASVAPGPAQTAAGARPSRYSEPVTATHANALDERTPAARALDRLRQRGRALTFEQRDAILARRPKNV